MNSKDIQTKLEYLEKQSFKNLTKEHPREAFFYALDDSDRLHCAVDLPGLPDELVSHSEAATMLANFAGLLMQSEASKTKTKPNRVNKKVKNLIHLLNDPDMQAILRTKIPFDEYWDIHKRLTEALGQRAVFPPKPPYIVYLPVESSLTPVECAEVVRSILHGFGFATNTSKTGLLVLTLDAIKSATGFKTNSQESARIACGGTR